MVVGRGPRKAGGGKVYSGSLGRIIDKLDLELERYDAEDQAAMLAELISELDNRLQIVRNETKA